MARNEKPINEAQAKNQGLPDSWPRNETALRVHAYLTKTLEGLSAGRLKDGYMSYKEALARSESLSATTLGFTVVDLPGRYGDLTDAQYEVLLDVKAAFPLAELEVWGDVDGHRSVRVEAKALSLYVEVSLDHPRTVAPTPES